MCKYCRKYTFRPEWKNNWEGLVWTWNHPNAWYTKRGWMRALISDLLYLIKI